MHLRMGLGKKVLGGAGGVGVAVGVMVGAIVGVAVGRAVGVGAVVGVAVGVGVMVGVGVEVGVGLGVDVGVAVGVGVAMLGSIVEVAFWGFEISRTLKSEALLSVSSPLPSSSSTPPLCIDIGVDVDLALRSILPPADGVAADTVSNSVAVPSPTLSMMVV